jgi:cytosine/adenosine deaminase-related metal-dependent hydrolase
MGWKKPADPVNVNFHARTTQGEREALDAVIARWAEKQAALGASASGTTTIAWFRQWVRKLAAEEGIQVNDPKPAAPTAEPAKGKAKKTAAKRGK